MAHLVPMNQFPYRYKRSFIRYSLNFDTFPPKVFCTSFSFSFYFSFASFPLSLLALPSSVSYFCTSFFSAFFSFFSFPFAFSSLSICSSLPPSRSSANDTRFFFFSVRTSGFAGSSVALRRASDVGAAISGVEETVACGREAAGFTPMMFLRWYWMRS